MRQTKSLNQEMPGLERILGNKKLKITGASTLGLLVSCSALVFVSRAHHQPVSEVAGPNSSTLSAPALSTTAALAAPRELVTTVKFNLFDAGIYPREVHVEKGLLAITIEDYSGGSQGVIVDRESGAAPERAGRVDRAGPHWRSRGEMSLGPGRYRVYMADRPANQALLVVEP